MSRTKKGPNRDPYDFYSTPEWCVHRLLEKISFPSAGYWLEPAAGNGAIVRSVLSYKNNLFYNSPSKNAFYAVEIQKKFEDNLRSVTPNVYIDDFFNFDFRRIKKLGNVKADVCIGNPPYNKALPTIQHALKQSNIVCMLLRINFLASEKRATWMQANTPDVYVLPNRPRFKNNKSDACEYGWFVWSKNTSGSLTILDVTPKQERKNG